MALGGGWLMLFVYALHAALPFNPIRLPLETQVQVKLWIPEGWAFFTRDPREEVTLLFTRRDDGKWLSALMGPNATISNDFGLNRASRIQGVETTSLLKKFPKSALRDCHDEPVVCLESIPTAGSVRNLSPNPSLCGQVGIVRQSPIPWAWWASGRPIIMPSRILRIDVICQ